ncbi:poly-gamma-glutamate hydrolase family protein [Priestia megaterium]
MADLYANFEALRKVNVYGTDYHILYGERNPVVTFFCPHGGGIESGCSELTIYSAGQNYSYYCFEGFRASGNTDLHITSTNFDEPNCKAIVSKATYTVSYHGYSDTVKNTKVGGLDFALKKRIQNKLIAGGFTAEIEPDDSSITGQEPDNIVNRNLRGKGVQLEISTPQRNAFFGTNTRSQRMATITQEFKNYVACVLSAIEEYKNQ